MDVNRSRILITDTDINTIKKLKPMLSGLGYEVFVSSSAEKSLLLLKFYVFDLIVLDVTIPNLDVLKVLETIHLTHSHTSVITSSNAASYDLAIETVRRGAYDLLVKPYDATRLLKLIDAALTEYEQIMQDGRISAEVDEIDNIHQFMVENSRDIQCIIDHEEKFTFINKRIETLLGYNRSDLIGEHYSMLVYKDDMAKIIFRFQDKQYDCPVSQKNELRLRCKIIKDGFRYFDITSIEIPHHIIMPKADSLKEHTKNFNGFSTFVIAHDITNSKKVEDIVNKKASYDHLTSLPNNILFHDRLKQAIANAKRDGTVFVVMYLDLDEFKVINDIYGHHIGDKVLQELSLRMQNCLRESDTLARVGGDEFTLLLPQVSDLKEANIIADKLIKSISEPFEIRKNTHMLSASIGIAFYPDDGRSQESLIQAADKAMYQIKNGQKNGFHYSLN
jgi:diguanylate cyclase (GGDEF)-like protein